MDYLHHISFGVGALGVLVILYGVVGGMFRFVRTERRSCWGRDVSAERRQLRHALGYFLLLGLEFLIAADIVDTLTKPGFNDLIVLGSMVLIRTVISHSLSAELNTLPKSEAGSN